MVRYIQIHTQPKAQAFTLLSFSKYPKGTLSVNLKLNKKDIRIRRGAITKNIFMGNAFMGNALIFYFRVITTVIAPVIAPVVILLSFTTLSHAHHSFAPYDIRSPIEISGKVDSFRYLQPHAKLILTDEEGVAWDIEVPNRRWQRQELAQDAIEAGDVLKVRIFPARNGNPYAAISSFTKEGTRYVVMEEVRQQSGNEAADAIESGEPVDEVLERYKLDE